MPTTCRTCGALTTWRPGIFTLARICGTCARRSFTMRMRDNSLYVDMVNRSLASLLREEARWKFGVEVQ